MGNKENDDEVFESSNIDDFIAAYYQPNRLLFIQPERHKSISYAG